MFELIATIKNYRPREFNIGAKRSKVCYSPEYPPEEVYYRVDPRIQRVLDALFQRVAAITRRTDLSFKTT